MGKISLWFDGGGTFGYGNIRRSLELGEVLASRGHNVSWRPLSRKATKLSLVSAHADLKPDIVVLDLPYNGDQRVIEATGFGAKVVALDYEGVVAPDLVISLQRVRQLPETPNILCGIEYAIVRQEILHAAPAAVNSYEVLVIVGGGDINNLTPLILAKLSSHSVCLIAGPAGITPQINLPNVRILRNPSSLPRLMAGCAWAVTTGGTCMLEMLSLGKAVHVVPRSGAEEVFARLFFEKGALLGVGLETLANPTHEQIRACGAVGQQLVDGRGAVRIATEIEKIL